MKSILQNKKECWLSRELHAEEQINWLEEHHVFNGALRKKSEKYGLKVTLNHNMHNEPPMGVHHNKENGLMLKKYAQKTAMQYYGWSLDDWRARFYKNYL